MKALTICLSPAGIISIVPLVQRPNWGNRHPGPRSVPGPTFRTSMWRHHRRTSGRPSADGVEGQNIRWARADVARLGDEPRSDSLCARCPGRRRLDLQLAAIRRSLHKGAARARMCSTPCAMHALQKLFGNVSTTWWPVSYLHAAMSACNSSVKSLSETHQASDGSRQTPGETLPTPTRAMETRW